MRKILFGALVSAALLAAVPTTALASRHHRHHHATVRHEQFGSAGTSTTAGTTAPTAGTVDNFSGGVLTIKLTDGTLVKGMVTSETELNCQSASAQTGEGDTSSSGDDQQSSGTQSSGTQSSGDDDQSSGTQSTSDDSGDQSGDDSGDDNQQSCSTTALAQGTTVQDARLSLSGAGAVWDEVDLVTP